MLPLQTRPCRQCARPSEDAVIDQQVPGLATSQPDVTLLLDRDGVIQQATLSQAASGEQPQPLVGRTWAETLAGAPGDEVRRLLAAASASGVAALGPVTQRFPSGLELPMEYTTVRLGSHGSLLAVGKCAQAVIALQSRLVAAQRAREQDYWRLREVEIRYRLLFDLANDAMVMVAADSLRILDANPAAIRAFGHGRGHDILEEFAAHDRDAVALLAQRVREHGRAPGILVHLGSDDHAWTLRASLFQSDHGAAFLLQFAAVGAASPGPDSSALISSDTYIECLPDGFVIMDWDGLVRRANPAFADMVETSSQAALPGRRLAHFMCAPDADLGALLAQVHRNGSVHGFVTSLHGDRGGSCDVEISAAGDIAGAAPGVAMIVRARACATPAAGAANTSPSPWFPALDRVGAVPLNVLVQEATEMMERQCIEAALARSHANRTAAAALLGVSRQSLYVKLYRYGLLRAGTADADAEL